MAEKQAHCTAHLVPRHLVVLGGGRHLMGRYILRGLASAIVVLEPFGFHLGLFLDDPVRISLGTWVYTEESAATHFCSRETPPARRGTPTAPPAKTRAAAAAALLAAGIVDFGCFLTISTRAVLDLYVRT